MRIHPDLEPLAVPVTELHTMPGNPRRGDVDAVMRSYQQFGQRKPIVARRADNTVLAGNHQLLAARQLGWDTIAVVFTDDDDETAAAFNLADNRTGDLGTYDDEALAAMLQTIQSPALLAATSYTDTDLARLLASMRPTPALTDADDVPDVTTPTTRPGDVWLLGPHRLVCGDATSAADAALAAGGHTLDIMWTDPPYGVNYVGGTADRLEIANDSPDDLPALLRDAFTTALTVLKPGAPCYVAHADSYRTITEHALASTGYSIRQNLIWVKSSMVLGHSDYHYRHEPILHAETPTEPEPDNTEPEPLEHEPILYSYTPGGTGRLGRGSPNWHGPDNATTVHEHPKPSRSREHPTMKPTALITGMTKNHTQPGDHIYDPFAGSGSTIIAAHQQQLIAHTIELDPHYCDIICQRYADHTGTTPTREADGIAYPSKQRT